MISIRRKLMAKMQSGVINTSPRIAEYGKRLRNKSIMEANSNCCYTEWYQVDDVPTVTYSFMWGGSGLQGDVYSSVFQTAKADGTPIDYYYWNRPYLFAGSEKIRFTLLISGIEDSWAYNPTDGQIWFAGKNTIYYGYTNINDMPTGT